VEASEFKVWRVWNCFGITKVQGTFNCGQMEWRSNQSLFSSVSIIPTFRISPLSSASKASGKVEIFTKADFCQALVHERIGERYGSLMSSVGPTPPSVLKLESWNFAYRLLILMQIKLIRGFSKFHFTAELRGLARFRHVKPIAFKWWPARYSLPHL